MKISLGADELFARRKKKRKKKDVIKIARYGRDSYSGKPPFGFSSWKTKLGSFVTSNINGEMYTSCVREKSGEPR